MKLNQTQRVLLERAHAHRIQAGVGYKAAWLRDPTSRGYAAVDCALDRLEAAETMERLAATGELALDAKVAA